jgi:sulfatase modifying factor 1
MRGESMTLQIGTAAVLVMFVAGPALAVNIETVPVGNPGNAPYMRIVGPCGAVDYEYEIGMYEVTAGQYCEFLNAVAVTDTYGLYNVNMSSHAYGCKIEQTGVPGSYTYSVGMDWAERPVNFVDWGDAVRFCNWLENGQPTGAQNLSTTEDGSYYLNGAMGNYALGLVRRYQRDGIWAIPNEDEWHKAAYHKNDGVTGDYFLVPTSSDNPPSNVVTDPDPGNNANYLDDYLHFGNGTWSIGSPYYRTEVGEFESSESPYGTFDQGGNVWEYTDTIRSTGLQCVIRGGSAFGGIGYLAAWQLSHSYLEYEDYDLGFRVAYVPEPGTLGLLMLGGLALMRWRRG